MVADPRRTGQESGCEKPDAKAPSSSTTFARTLVGTVDQWRTLISRTFVEVRPESLDPAQFRGELDCRARAGLGVSVISGSRQTVRRGAGEIRRSPGRRLFFIFQAEGVGRVEHEGGTMDMRAGDCVLVHPDRPYVLGFRESFRQVCIQVPEWRLREREIGAIEPAYGRPLAPSRGVAHVLGAATEALLIDDDDEDGDSATELFLDVLGRSLRGAGPGEALLDVIGTKVCGRRLRKFIAEHYRTEGLAPAHAAAEFGCSLRNIHKVCHALGTTFGRMLLDARLAAASERLTKRGEGAARISDVAYDCGFGDLSHFSRAFKSRFGASPQRFRRDGL